MLGLALLLLAALLPPWNQIRASLLEDEGPLEESPQVSQPSWPPQLWPQTHI